MQLDKSSYEFLERFSTKHKNFPEKLKTLAKFKPLTTQEIETIHETLKTHKNKFSYDKRWASKVVKKLSHEFYKIETGQRKTKRDTR